MDDGPEKGADGMTIDSDGHVYCAGASDIWIWSPDGRLVEKLAVPTRPINCTFGDADRKSLYITGFGGVYRQRMRVAGLPPVPAE
jgi:gluconolactonase